MEFVWKDLAVQGEEAEQWQERIERGRALVARLGSVDAAIAELDRRAPGSSLVESFIPLLHEHGFSGRDIAARLGLTQSKVSRRIRKLIELGLAQPVDLSLGGGATRTKGPQVKAAGAYRWAARNLLAAGLEHTSPSDRALVRSTILEFHDEIGHILGKWATE